MRIYCITNSANGKRYVGQTIQSIETRWRQHCSLQGKCRAIESAIKKYGSDAFSIEEIALAESIEELDRLEQKWIARLNTVAPNGYNLSGGGEGAGVMNESTKAIIRANAMRPEHLARFEEMRSKPEVRAKMAEELKARWSDPDFKKKAGAAISASLNNPDVKARRNAALVLAASKPENKAKLAAAMAEVRARPEVNAKRAESMRKAWDVPGAREQRAAAIRAAKTSPEFKAKIAARKLKREEASCR